MRANYQNIIIGFGKAGKTLAKTLAVKGETVAVIEMDEKMYGGTCINVACIPSKTLIVNGQKNKTYTESLEIKNNLIGKLRQKNYHMLADEEGIDVINGKGRFLSNTEVEVTTVEGEVLKLSAEKIFINTGAKPFIPPIKGVEGNPFVVTSKEMLDINHAPKRLAIIGGGYIGLEFASMFHHFGSKITILNDQPTFLPREDEDIAALVVEDMTEQGIEFVAGVKISEIENLGDHAGVSYEDAKGNPQKLQADAVLVATGRTPNTEGLGLENTSVTQGARGGIVTDAFLKTEAPNIWAMGDVRGELQFTYISLDDFRIVADQLFGEGERRLSDRNIVPNSVFLTPALSNVGLTEKQAKAQNIQYKLFKLPVAAIPKANVLGSPKGLFKALVDPNTQEILGATLYGEESYELINLIALAMKAKLPYTLLKNQIYTHPTMAEAFNDLFK